MRKTKTNGWKDLPLSMRGGLIGLVISLPFIGILWSACILDIPDIFHSSYSCIGVPLGSAALIIGLFLFGFIVGIIVDKVKER